MHFHRTDISYVIQYIEILDINIYIYTYSTEITVTYIMPKMPAHLPTLAISAASSVARDVELPASCLCPKSPQNHSATNCAVPCASVGKITGPDLLPKTNPLKTQRNYIQTTMGLRAILRFDHGTPSLQEAIFLASIYEFESSQVLPEIDKAAHGSTATRPCLRHFHPL